MKWSGFGFKKDQQVPVDAIFDDKDGRAVDSDLWLNSKNSSRWKLVQSSVYMPYYRQTLVLIFGERCEES
jgi:hypothetical protein